MYSVYLINVKSNPTYTHMSGDSAGVTFLVILTCILVVIYILWLTYVIIITFWFFCRMPVASRVMFSINILLIITAIATLIAGVYSYSFSNGGMFLFFNSLFNIYCIIVVFLNWPYKLEEELSMREEHSMKEKFEEKDLAIWQQKMEEEK